MFEDDAINFAAKKTAALSGDLRKALHICKAAAEDVMKEVEAGTRIVRNGEAGVPTVSIQDVSRVSRVIFGSVLSMAVAYSTSFEALLLVSLASLSRTTGRQHGGVDIQELMTKMDALSGSSGDVQYAPPPTFGETLEMLNRLGGVRILDEIRYFELCSSGADTFATLDYRQGLSLFIRQRAQARHSVPPKEVVAVRGL